MLPSEFWVGGDHESVTAVCFGMAATVMEKAGSAVEALPSVAEISMLAYEPASPAAGLPVSAPVAAVKVAQEGLFTMVNVTVSLSASEADGVKLYATPSVADFPAVPLMVGAVLAGVAGGVGVIGCVSGGSVDEAVSASELSPPHPVSAKAEIKKLETIATRETLKVPMCDTPLQKN